METVTTNFHKLPLDEKEHFSNFHPIAEIYVTRSDAGLFFSVFLGASPQRVPEISSNKGYHRKKKSIKYQLWH